MYAPSKWHHRICIAYQILRSPSLCERQLLNNISSIHVFKSSANHFLLFERSTWCVSVTNGCVRSANGHTGKRSAVRNFKFQRARKLSYAKWYWLIRLQKVLSVETPGFYTYDIPPVGNSNAFLLRNSSFWLQLTSKQNPKNEGHEDSQYHSNEPRC